MSQFVLPDSVRVGVGQGVSVSGVYKVTKPFGPCMPVPTVNLKDSKQTASLEATVSLIVFTCFLFLQEKHVLLLELYY